MPTTSTVTNGHRRASSGSTVRAAASVPDVTTTSETLSSKSPVQAGLWVHDDAFSPEEILINPSILTGSGISEGDLIEVVSPREGTNVIDFESGMTGLTHEQVLESEQVEDKATSGMTCLCVVKLAPQEMSTKHPGLEVSMTRTIAEAFKLRSRVRVVLKPSNFEHWTASHIELSFRDAYLARSDMWRLVSQELANRVVYRGQKISFLGTIKLTIKEVHVKGHRVSTGYFAGTTIPVFRSEAARYVLFIQMSREMWDFDSEGNGEIMFNRVVNGFLPELFRRWVQLDARHLVSIVMFGRMEYDRYDFGDPSSASTTDRFSHSSSASSSSSVFYQDFFRVVVTDMASAQWTTILNELKKDFRVFLRDMSLHKPVAMPTNKDLRDLPPKITGRPSTALKGNILEAINLASSQFANDYIDRDLIRTGISTIVITAGTGVFDVDRDLLNLTSQNLTNNGIGIDIVCLSKMPLHSVPLFRYRLPISNALSRVESNVSCDTKISGTSHTRRSAPLDHSSTLSSFTGTSATYFTRFPSAFPSKIPQPYGYGIPHWIDLSYWQPSLDGILPNAHKRTKASKRHASSIAREPFIPRVRMYELQMMGLMELGMADIAIPYLNDIMQTQRRPRQHSSADLEELVSVKNLSQSPSYFRKTSALAYRRRGSTGAPSRTSGVSEIGFESMDKYDERLFANVDGQQGRTRPRCKRTRTKVPKKIEYTSQSRPTSNLSKLDKSEQNSPKSAKILASTAEKHSQDRLNEPSSKLQTAIKTPRISRSVSYALRGLSTPLKSAAAPSESQLENIKALPSIAKTSLAQANATAPSVVRADSLRNVDHRDTDRRSIMSSDTATENPSKPISITALGHRPISQQVSHKLEKPVPIKATEAHETSKSSRTWPNSPSISSEDEATEKSRIFEGELGSVPRSTLPFIRNVNASNPLKGGPKAESIFGRWQHLYPHKPRASTVKWRSLCTPASVPLTTEDFPSAKELSEDYETVEHRVQMRQGSDGTTASAKFDALLFEMIVLRVSHGYQIVIGEAVENVIGNTLCEASVFLDPSQLRHHGDTVLMSMGNTIQKLSFADPEYIYVTKYTKKDADVEHPFSLLYNYNPNIRTILSSSYISRNMVLRGFSEEYPWETADNYLADGEIDSSSKVNKLRFWRARFVLLPVEPPVNTWRSQLPNEESEEEIHLLGIRTLTRMWQKARHFTLSERIAGPGRMGANRRQDQNPLEIRFETLNTSELVATELDKMLTLEDAGEMAPTQLLPDAEKLDRDTTMVKLAQAMQGERGIEIKNRRWHLRLYYNCFHGEEFTNWLLHNVKSIETREEVVEFGNQLMKEGLFEHVNGKHSFKDGNYFYSLKQEFKIPRIDPKASWFPGVRRSDRSVPPTPLSEHPSRELPQVTTRSRSGSSLAYSFNPATPLDSSRAFMEKKKKIVTLTKMIKIDVDTRKRSNRPEIVNLHYDRFHNPENCYHIELSWLNTTSKLVDDAIVSWTTQAEKYGLKLVEVPIAEAHKIPEAEPFRRTFEIKLALEPPKRQSTSHVLTSNSFTPQPYQSLDKHFYQKALLKRFNFVLDLEGSSEFSDNVDVRYSSAGLEYKYTQFVHRSGVCLAQISDEGTFLLLANRLYNARFATAKEVNSLKLDPRRDLAIGSGPPPRPSLPPPYNSGHHAMQASGIVGLNVQSPRLSTTPSPSPMARATADVFGSRSAISGSSIAQFVTPEQIKDELDQFCTDPVKLEQFYKEFSSNSSAPQPSSATSRRSAGGGTSSSALKPIPDANEGIPEFVLPESVTTPSTSSSGFGIGFGGLLSRRSRPSGAYDSVAETFSRAGIGLERSEGSRDHSDGGNNHNNTSGGSKSNSGEVSGRTSADVSGNLELKIRVDTPGMVAKRIEEGIEEGMREHIGSPTTKAKS